MKHTYNKITMMVAACGMLAATSCSDFDDYNSVPSAQDPAADKTLWENIRDNNTLSDFADVLVRTGYDKVLDASHTYTVWAPINGSFNVDSLKAVSDEKVEKEFLKNLIADYSHRETDMTDTVVYMLNEKLLKFSNKGTGYVAFDGQKLVPSTVNPAVFNYPSTNGLLYIVSAPATFRYNGYEYLFELAGVADSMMAYVKRYEQNTLDESKSVKGDIKDGVQHYDDSVMILKNTLIEETLKAQLNNEDSLYTFFIPTNKAWSEAYENLVSYYNYIPAISWQNLTATDMDKSAKTGKTAVIGATVGTTSTTLTTPPANSLLQETGAYWTDSIAKNFITRTLIFSETEKHYNSKLTTGAAFTENDTLYSTNEHYRTYLPELDAATTDVVKLSNGHARIIDNFPYGPANVIQTLNVGRIVTAEGANYDRYYCYKNAIDPSICVLPENQTGLSYVKASIPEGSNYAAELDFYLPNVLSTTYTVYAIIVPACLENYAMAEEDRKPYTLVFDINYTDASNTQISGRFNGEEVLTKATEIKKIEPFEVGRDKVDTLKLGKVTFPICYYGTEAKPNIKVAHGVTSFLSSTKKKYEQELRIAGIVLVPEGVDNIDEEWKNRN